MRPPRDKQAIDDAGAQALSNHHHQPHHAIILVISLCEPASAPSAVVLHLPEHLSRTTESPCIALVFFTINTHRPFAIRPVAHVSCATEAGGSPALRRWITIGSGPKIGHSYRAEPDPEG
jgi:hypothetical protein